MKYDSRPLDRANEVISHLQEAKCMIATISHKRGLALYDSELLLKRLAKIRAALGLLDE